MKTKKISVVILLFFIFLSSNITFGNSDSTTVGIRINPLLICEIDDTRCKYNTGEKCIGGTHWEFDYEHSIICHDKKIEPIINGEKRLMFIKGIFVGILLTLIIKQIFKKNE